MSKPRTCRAARWLSAATVTFTLMIVPVSAQAAASAAAAAKPTVVLVPTAGLVVLVGHSYGGAVITNAATSDPDVQALVYVNAFAPALGESVFGLAAAQPGSALAADPTIVFDLVQYPGAPTGDVDAYVKPVVFAQAFADDLPARTAAALGAAQRPITLGAGSAPSGEPAWAVLPSWYLVGTADKVLPPAQQRAMAARANAATVEVRAGHLSMLSQPGRVTRLIEDAARASVGGVGYLPVDTCA